MKYSTVYLAACLACAGNALAAAPVIGTYDSASFVEIGKGLVRLDGFGRGASSELRIGASRPSLAAERQVFFDTWNVGTAGITPGLYSFIDLTVPAIGSVEFSSLTFNSIDAAGVRSTILFDIDATGKLATGSGQFTVLASCPIASCVWIDVIGTQDVGSPASGYGGGSIVAAPVPEPETYAMFALGLAGLGVALRRRRS